MNKIQKLAPKTLHTLTKHQGCCKIIKPEITIMYYAGPTNYTAIECRLDECTWAKVGISTNVQDT